MGNIPWLAQNIGSVVFWGIAVFLVLVILQRWLLSPLLIRYSSPIRLSFRETFSEIIANRPQATLTKKTALIFKDIRQRTFLRRTASVLGFLGGVMVVWYCYKQHIFGMDWMKQPTPTAEEISVFFVACIAFPGLCWLAIPYVLSFLVRLLDSLQHLYNIVSFPLHYTKLHRFINAAQDSCQNLDAFTPILSGLSEIFWDKLFKNIQQQLDLTTFQNLCTNLVNYAASHKCLMLAKVAKNYERWSLFLQEKSNILKYLAPTAAEKQNLNKYLSNIQEKISQKGVDAVAILKDLLPKMRVSCSSIAQFVTRMDLLVHLDASCWNANKITVTYQYLVNYESSRDALIQSFGTYPAEQNSLRDYVDNLREQVGGLKGEGLPFLLDILGQARFTCVSGNQFRQRMANLMRKVHNWSAAPVLAIYQQLVQYENRRDSIINKLDLSVAEKQEIVVACNYVEERLYYYNIEAHLLIFQVLPCLAQNIAYKQDFLYWLKVISQLEKGVLQVFVENLFEVIAYWSNNRNRYWDDLPIALNQFYIRTGSLSSCDSLLVYLTAPDKTISARVAEAEFCVMEEMLIKQGVPRQVFQIQEIGSLGGIIEIVRQGSMVARLLEPGIKNLLPNMGKHGLWSYYRSMNLKFYNDFVFSLQSRGANPDFDTPGLKWYMSYEEQKDFENISLNHPDENTALPIANRVTGLQRLVKNLRDEYPFLYQALIEPVKGKLAKENLQLEDMLNSEELLIARGKIQLVQMVCQRLLNLISSREKDLSDATKCELLASLVEIMIRDRIPDYISKYGGESEYWENLSSLMNEVLKPNTKYYNPVKRVFQQRRDAFYIKKGYGPGGLLFFFLSGRGPYDFLKGYIANDCTASNSYYYMHHILDPAVILFKIVESGKWVGVMNCVVTVNRMGALTFYVDWLKFVEKPYSHPLVGKGCEWNNRRSLFAEQLVASLKQYLTKEGFKYLVFSDQLSSYDTSSNKVKQALLRVCERYALSRDIELKKVGGLDYAYAMQVPITFPPHGVHLQNLPNPTEFCNIRGYQFELNKPVVPSFTNLHAKAWPFLFLMYANVFDDYVYPEIIIFGSLLLAIGVMAILALLSRWKKHPALVQDTTGGQGHPAADAPQAHAETLGKACPAIDVGMYTGDKSLPLQSNQPEQEFFSEPLAPPTREFLPMPPPEIVMPETPETLVAACRPQLQALLAAYQQLEPFDRKGYANLTQATEEVAAKCADLHELTGLLAAVTQQQTVVRKRIEKSLLRLIKTLKMLLAIPSPSGQEEKVRATLTRLLTDMGGSMLYEGSEIKNLVWEIPATDAAHKLVLGLDAHIDVVGKGGAELALKTYAACQDSNVALEQVLQNCEQYVLCSTGKDYGTAALDDKVGVALMVELVRVLQEEKLPHGKIRLFFTAEEEPCRLHRMSGAADIVSNHADLLTGIDLLIPIDGHLLQSYESHDGMRGPLAVKFMNLTHKQEDFRYKAVMAAGKKILGDCHRPKEFSFSAGNELSYASIPNLAIAHLRANYKCCGHTVQDSIELQDFAYLAGWLVEIVRILDGGSA